MGDMMESILKEITSFICNKYVLVIMGIMIISLSLYMVGDCVCTEIISYGPCLP